MTKYVVFRTDASLQIGSGHVMRCLTLADTLKVQGVSCHFVCREHNGHLVQFIRQRGHEVTVLPVVSLAPLAIHSVTDPIHASWLGCDWLTDAQQTSAILDIYKPDWLVIDHYALDGRWESLLRPIVRNIMVIDDIADRQHDCDVLLDQNYYVDMATRYNGKVPAHCQLLLGPEYALLRDEFRELRSQAKPRVGPVRRILVFFGGIDLDNYTSLAIEALKKIDGRDMLVDVVIGLQHPCREDIETACARYGFNCHVQTNRLAELMAEADLTIGAGGSATWERCCLGLPTFSIPVAQNQVQLVNDAASQGLLYAPKLNAGDISRFCLHLQAILDNPKLREHISRNAMDRVDGRGTLRVVHALGINKVKMRLADASDSLSLHAWRNHPSIRGVSRNREPVSLDNHERWLRSVLEDTNRALLIGYIGENQPVGVVRFDMAGDCAEISIYLVPGLNRKGLGAELLDNSEKWLSRNHTNIRRIRAVVLNDNVASHRLFEVAGYEVDSTCYVKGI